jgi:hypothetical protein
VTIAKGTHWGMPGLLPPGAPMAANDAALRTIVEIARRSGGVVPVVGLTGGTLWQTMGGPSAVGRLTTGSAMRYAVDVVRAEIDDDAPRWFVSALVARNTSWTRTTVAMNGQFVGPYRFGVRAHPGDGLVDVYEARLSPPDVVKVAARAKRGAHLPHPGIRELRSAECRLDFTPPRRVWLDGEVVGRARTVRLSVEADALTVVV